MELKKEKVIVNGKLIGYRARAKNFYAEYDPTLSGWYTTLNTKPLDWAGAFKDRKAAREHLQLLNGNIDNAEGK